MMNLSLSKGRFVSCNACSVSFHYFTLLNNQISIEPRPKARSAASIILRGANDFMLDEMERSLHDALCVVKRVLDSKKVVPGGGAVEAALSIYLENFATSLVSSNLFKFLSIQKFKPCYINA